MNSFRAALSFSFFAVFIFLISCATPVPPTGGPPDKEGPVVEVTDPESGSTNFTGTRFDFYFSEFVNRGSVSGNINIEPDLGIQYSTKWRRKRLTVAFEDELPDSTTIIVTLGSDISDTRGNKMGAPITVAVSTGDEIDKGTLTGKIRLAASGGRESGMKVLLYRSPFDLDTRATYQAQTDTSGTFNFSYLREGTYKAIFVDDRNRNKIWDQASEHAQPFRRETIELEKEGSDTLDVLYVIRRDTLAPALQGVGMFSANRMRLRFNENIDVSDSSTISIQDSLGNTVSTAYPLYVSLREGFVLFVQSENLLIENDPYSLGFTGITDAAGNPAKASGVTFTGSAQEDTTLQRIINSNSETGLFPQQPLEVIYAAPVSDPMITDSIVVVEGDVTFEDWPEIKTERNKLLISPQERWIEGVDYQFLVWNPRTQRRQIFSPRTWDQVEFGSIELTVEDADSASVFEYRIENEASEIIRTGSFTNFTEVNDLPPLDYTITVFQDVNNNGEWDSGSISPYNSPEPYYIQPKLTVRTGFASEVIISF